MHNNELMTPLKTGFSNWHFLVSCWCQIQYVQITIWCHPSIHPLEHWKLSICIGLCIVPVCAQPLTCLKTHLKLMLRETPAQVKGLPTILSETTDFHCEETQSSRSELYNQPLLTLFQTTSQLCSAVFSIRLAKD